MAVKKQDVAAWQTDWLATEPVFFNVKTGHVSGHFHDVVDYANLEFDPDGLHNYLEFGYSVFGQTPVRHVKFLLPCQRLTRDDGKLMVSGVVDPVHQLLECSIPEAELIENIVGQVQLWEAQQEGPVIVPTSGGLDSRFLNYALRNKSAVQTFTYGISDRQDRSSEVVLASELSRRLGVSWRQIELGEFNRYIPDWLDYYGVAVHAHGMYHMEFYSQIQASGIQRGSVLSGMIGDIWAGMSLNGTIESPDDLTKLSHSHGLSVDPMVSRLHCQGGIKSAYFDSIRSHLSDSRWRVVQAMRFKVMLLRYLIEVPSALGYHVHAPFLDPEIAVGMLTLPEGRRKNRIWQREFFDRHNLSVESNIAPVDYGNTLDRTGLRHKLPPFLNQDLLEEVIDPAFIAWVNLHMPRNRRVARALRHWLRPRSRFAPLLDMLGIDDRQLDAYTAYTVLRPIEDALQRRNATA